MKKNFGEKLELLSLSNKKGQFMWKNKIIHLIGDDNIYSNS
jgi:hypothetical protein